MRDDHLSALAPSAPGRPVKPYHPKACALCGQLVTRAKPCPGRQPARHCRCRLLVARVAQVERATGLIRWTPEGANRAAATLLQIAHEAAAAPTTPQPQAVREASCALSPREVARLEPPRPDLCRVCANPTRAQTRARRCRSSTCSRACIEWSHRVEEAARLLPAAWGSDDARDRFLQRLVALAAKITDAKTSGAQGKDASGAQNP